MLAPVLETARCVTWTPRGTVHYDFVEIGTANFATLIEQATPTTVGISVEPIRHYLDQLPSPPGVCKLPVAISRTGQFGDALVYYVPETVIRERGLPSWLVGCNSVGAMHRAHRILGVEDLVVTEQVSVMPLHHVMTHYNVTALDHLKLDTEGSDSEILLTYLDHYRNQGNVPLPRKITFESNILTAEWQIQLVIENYRMLGYDVVRSQLGTEGDTTLTLCESRIQ